MTTQLERTETPVLTPLETALADRQRLIDRMQAGDATVTGDDFERAEAAVRFATIQERVAADRAVQDAEAARLEQIAALVRELTEREASPVMASATRALGKALDQFAATCATYNARHTEIYTELAGLGALPPGLTISPGQGDIQLPDGPIVRQASTERLIYRAMTTALTTHFPRMQLRIPAG